MRPRITSVFDPSLRAIRDLSADPPTAVRLIQIKFAQGKFARGKEREGSPRTSTHIPARDRIPLETMTWTG